MKTLQNFLSESLICEKMDWGNLEDYDMSVPGEYAEFIWDVFKKLWNDGKVDENNEVSGDFIIKRKGDKDNKPIDGQFVVRLNQVRPYVMAIQTCFDGHFWDIDLKRPEVKRNVDALKKDLERNYNKLWAQQVYSIPDTSGFEPEND